MRSGMLVSSICALSLVALGCVVVDGGGRGSHHHRPAARAPGPPPHAPAHGYRHKHGGRDLVFDSQLGVYAVVGLPDVWFSGGHYVRWYGGRWEIGVEMGGPWRVAQLDAVPYKLRAKRHPHGGPPGQLKKKAKR
jgi:hypothetical protein